MRAPGSSARTLRTKFAKLLSTASGVRPSARSLSPAYTITCLGLYWITSSRTSALQSRMVEPPKPRLSKTGTCLKSCDNRDHIRIVELPTNNTPSLAGCTCWSVTAKASSVLCQRA